MEWFYVTDAGERLPAADAELGALARSGTVRPWTLLWTPGQADWKPCVEVRPELFSAGMLGDASAGVCRPVMEPLWQRRGWLAVAALGVCATASLRGGLAAVEAWPDSVRLAGVGLALAASLSLVFLLLKWWSALAQSAQSGSVADARTASQAGSRVLLLAGLIGAAFALIVAFDLVSLAAHHFVNR